MGVPTTMAPVFDGLPLSGSDLNNNLYLLEQSMLGVGCYVITGLGLTPGAGLSVVVSSGTAVLGVMQTFAVFTIGSLTDNTLNYLFLNQDGTADASVSPITPAGALCLGTAATVGGTVSGVSITQSSGRQQYVQPRAMILGGPTAGNPPSQNLASWAASAADGVSFYGTLPAATVPSTLGATTFSGDVTLSTHNLITDTVTGTKIGTSASQLLGFYGSTPVAQIGGATDLLAGLVSQGLRGASSNPPLNLGTGALTAGAATLHGDLTLATHNLVTDTLTGTQIGTSATQLLGFYGAAPVAQIGGGVDILAGLVTQGLRGASANPNLNMGTGTLTAGAAVVSGVSFIGAVEITTSWLMGNSQMLRVGFATANYGTDADKTLNAAQYAAAILSVTSGLSLTATRNLIFPLNQGGIVIVHNGTTGGQAIQVIGATGTGVAIGSGKTATVYCDGTNFLRATPDI